MNRLFQMPHVKLKLVIGVSILLINGCTPTYMAKLTSDFGKEINVIDHFKIERSRSIVISPDVSLYIAMTANDQGEVISRKITQSISDQFSPKFKVVTQGYALESYDQALNSAKMNKADFFIFATMTKWQDSLNSREDYHRHSDLKKIGLDDMGLKMLLIDTKADYVVDVVNLYVESGFFTLYGDKPDDLLAKPLAQYADLISAPMHYR